MKKYSIITILAIIAIVFPVAYGIWSIFSVEQLQLRTFKNQFSYFEMSNNEKIKICNPTPFFVSFDEVEMDVYYLNDIKGTFIVESRTLEPNASIISDVNFTSESFAESQYLFMHMDGEFGGTVPVRLDPNQMVVTTTYLIKIIGLIPYQQTITQSAFDFTQMMNENSSCEDIG